MIDLRLTWHHERRRKAARAGVPPQHGMVGPVIGAMRLADDQRAARHARPLALEHCVPGPAVRLGKGARDAVPDLECATAVHQKIVATERDEIGIVAIVPVDLGVAWRLEQRARRRTCVRLRRMKKCERKQDRQ